MRTQWRKYVAITAILAVLLTGCASNQTSGSSTSTASTNTATSTAVGTVATLTSSEVVVDTEYTASDLEVGYDESSAIQITLNGSSIETSSTDGVTISTNTLTITTEGTYVISGTLNNGQIIVDADEKDKVHIILNGVNLTCSDNAPIYIKSADKVFITLEDGTENTLTDGSTYTQTDDTDVDGVIYSKSDLTLNGTGTLTITGNYKHGITSKDDLVITGGTYNITAVKDGLNGKDCVKIKDGTFNISVTEGNGIQSKNADDTTKGYVYISGGTININNSQEGIEGTAILVEGGTVNVVSQDDGLNATSASSDTTDDAATTSTTAVDTASTASNTDDTAIVTTSSDATTSTTDSTDTNPATDDSAQFDRGVRDGSGKGGAGMENDANAYILITGGTVNVNAAGDGLDSNGSVYISGGNVYVNGPTDSGNAGLDYNGTANVTGGTVVVAGSAGMAQGFSDTSTQYSIIYNFTSVNEAGTEVTLTDADGNVVVSYTPEKQFQSVVISSPDLKEGATYTLTSGSQTADVTLSSVVTSGGEQSTGMDARGGNGGMNDSFDDDQNTDNSTDSSAVAGSN